MKGQLRALEEELNLPRRLEGPALAARVSEEMVTWSMLQREIETRSHTDEIDLDWECRRDSAREREDLREEGETPW